MKKALVLVGLVLLSMFLLAGCGGGGDSGKVTTYFHVEDSSVSPLVGLYVVYTDPSGSAITSPTTDSNGDATIVTTQVGTYTVNYAEYGGRRYYFSYTARFSNTQSDLDNNLVTAYTIVVDTTSGWMRLVRTL
jgi:hypothetical protein